jgi:hypothetical protein
VALPRGGGGGGGGGGFLHKKNWSISGSNKNMCQVVNLAVLMLHRRDCLAILIYQLINSCLCIYCLRLRKERRHR